VTGDRILLDEHVGRIFERLLYERGYDVVQAKDQFGEHTDDEQRVAAAYDLHDASNRLDETDGGIDSEDWDAVTPDQSHPSEQDSSEDG
jgi:hypothetical protein